jgi:hypothetical protein
MLAPQKTTHGQAGPGDLRDISVVVVRKTVVRNLARRVNHVGRIATRRHRAAAMVRVKTTEVRDEDQ